MCLRSPTRCPDGPEAFSELARAWSVTTVALALLLAALVLAPMWDRATIMQALHEALSRGAQLMQSLDALADSTASPETSVRRVASHSDSERLR
jgi:hypothetical protein